MLHLFLLTTRSNCNYQVIRSSTCAKRLAAQAPRGSAQKFLRARSPELRPVSFGCSAIGMFCMLYARYLVRGVYEVCRCVRITVFAVAMDAKVL